MYNKVGFPSMPKILKYMIPNLYNNRKSWRKATLYILSTLLCYVCVCVRACEMPHAYRVTISHSW